jgi:hypothetical protein
LDHFSKQGHGSDIHSVHAAVGRLKIQWLAIQIPAMSNYFGKNKTYLSFRNGTIRTLQFGALRKENSIAETYGKSGEKDMDSFRGRRRSAA